MSEAAADLLRARISGAPRHAIVLGSGLGSLVDAVEDALRIPYAELPGFPASSVSGFPLYSRRKPSFDASFDA